MMVGQGVFILASVWIVALGVKAGLERSINWMMPALFMILITLVVYAAVTGDFRRAVSFLFTPQFDLISPKVILAAFGQAFFSLGIGLGVMLTYGAYMPAKSNALSSAVIIAFSDGLVSVLAGLAIFPIVFKYGLSPAEGPGLIFMTLPVAFKAMPGGGIAGAFFFVLLFFAALTSSISLLESIISGLEERLPYSRKKITVVAGVLLFLLGLGTVFSFNIWADWKPLSPVGVLSGKNFFEVIDYISSNLIMPMGGILMAVIAGWVLKSKDTKAEMKLRYPGVFYVWLFLVRFIAPLMLGLVFISNL
jgi:NSS family neurotransmitter:Na+ symporter